MFSVWRHKNTQSVEEKWRLNQPALVVAGFGPRIGKVDMQRVERLIRHMGTNPPVGVRANHAGVGKLMAPETISGKITIGSCPFHGEILSSHKTHTGFTDAPASRDSAAAMPDTKLLAMACPPGMKDGSGFPVVKLLMPLYPLCGDGNA